MNEKIDNENNNLWVFINKDKMKDYVNSDNKVNMENEFVNIFKKTISFPIKLLSVIIRQTRSGLYFNIYDKKKKIGHASFHYDEGKPGSISHVVNDRDYVRDDLIIKRNSKYNLKFVLKGYIDDMYGFFSSVADGLSGSFNTLLESNQELIEH